MKQVGKLPPQAVTLTRLRHDEGPPMLRGAFVVAWTGAMPC
jgi:hypothetical protein